MRCLYKIAALAVFFVLILLVGVNHFVSALTGTLV